MADRKKTFADLVRRDPAYWSPTQAAAYRAACREAGVGISAGGARTWKRGRGAAFRAWRALTKTQRRERIAEDFKRRRGEISP